MAEDTVYPVSIGMKIFYGVIALGLFGFSIYLLTIYKPSVNPAVLLIPLLMVVAAVLIIINLFKKKVIISSTGITFINLFSIKTLLFDEIKGCRVDQRTICVEPIAADKAKIAIGNYTDLADSEGLANWFSVNFKDLDSSDIKEAEEKMLADTTLGFTPEDRANKLKTIKYIAGVYNVAGFLLCFGSAFFDGKAEVILLIIYPLLSIPIMLSSKGIIKFLSDPKSGVNSYVIVGVLFPSVTMLIKGLGNYDIYAYNVYYFTFGGLSLVVFTLFYLVGINKSIEFIKGQIIVMLIAALIYSAGATTQINCAFDGSTPTEFRTSVISKDMEYSKGNHYYVSLNPWDASRKTQHIEVSHSFYDSESAGNIMIVNMKKGLLNIRWFYISEN